MRYTSIALISLALVALNQLLAATAQSTPGRVLTEATSAPGRPISALPTTPAPSALALSISTHNTDTILIPRETIVVVETLQGYNSYGAQTGEKLRYQVAQDVIVNGYVIAKAGDTAYGAVQGAQAGRMGGYYGIGYKAADLRVSVDEVYNFCGDTMHVDFDRSEYRRRQGLFGSNADVQVTKGQKYAAVTDRVQKVCGEITTEAPLPIPSDALRTAGH